MTEVQTAMFRVGHAPAHAGVIVIRSIIAGILVNHADLPDWLAWMVRIGFPVSANLIPGVFLGGAVGNRVTGPQGRIRVLYTGAVVQFARLLPASVL